MLWQRNLMPIIKESVVFIGVLNGAFMFASDLMKGLDLNLEISFVKVSSYSGTQSSGIVKELIGLNNSINDKHVIVIEDIVDTGRTADKLLNFYAKKHQEVLKCAHFYSNQMLLKVKWYQNTWDSKFLINLLLVSVWTTMRSVKT